MKQTLAIICSGQGGQHAGMFNMLREYPASQAIINQVMPKGAATEDLFVNRAAQPLLCAYQLASWAALQPLLPPVRVFAGYSIGELAAYGCAGALDPLTCIRLARLRASLMDQACDSATRLISIRGLNKGRLVVALQGLSGGIALINGPDRFVWGGTAEMVEQAAKRVSALGANVTALPVGIASHTFLMHKAVAPFRTALEKSLLTSPLTPVLAGVTGASVYRREKAIQALSDQIAQTVDWHACMTAILEMGCTTLLELGPGNALAQLAHDVIPDVAARSLSDFRSINGAAAWISRHVQPR